MPFTDEQDKCVTELIKSECAYIQVVSSLLEVCIIGTLHFPMYLFFCLTFLFCLLPYQLFTSFFAEQQQQQQSISQQRQQQQSQYPFLNQFLNKFPHGFESHAQLVKKLKASQNVNDVLDAIYSHVRVLLIFFF